MTSSRAADLFGPRGHRPSRSWARGWAGSRPASPARAGSRRSRSTRSRSGSAAPGGTTSTPAPRSTSTRTSTRSPSSATTGRARTPARPRSTATSRRRSTSSASRRTSGSAPASQRAVWDDDRHVYRLTLTTGEETECHVLISAVGFLNVPLLPRLAGPRRLRGAVLPHLAVGARARPRREDGRGRGHRIDRVAARPRAPAGGRQAARCSSASPGWVLPKGDRDYTAEERARLHNPVVHRYRRAKWYWATEKRLWNGGDLPAGDARQHRGRAGRAAATSRRCSRTVPTSRPRSRRRYPFWGKRTIFSSDFYPAL